jgi:V/A-type H+-transporting ATPase subunit E
MNEKTKESKFLDAINRYAEQQKAKITAEIEEYTAQKIEQATDSGLRDAYELIRHNVSVRKAALMKDAAQQEYAMRSALFEEREAIRSEVFGKAAEKLAAYTKTDDYHTALIHSAEEIAALLEGEACIVSLKESDLRFSDEIIDVIPNAEVQADAKIIIGGMRVFCPSKHIEADDTLDTKLAEQKRWFAEHSGLKVV